jgi:hypothetical protein
MGNFNNGVSLDRGFLYTPPVHKYILVFGKTPKALGVQTVLYTVSRLRQPFFFKDHPS